MGNMIHYNKKNRIDVGTGSILVPFFTATILILAACAPAAAQVGQPQWTCNGAITGAIYKIIPASCTYTSGVLTFTSAGSTTTLPQTYANGGAGPQNINLDATRLGIGIRDAVTPIGQSLFFVSNANSSSKFLDVQASAITVLGSLTQSSGAFSLTGTGASALQSTGTLTIDSSAAINVGQTNATSLGFGKAGITTTFNGTLAFPTGSIAGTALANTVVAAGSYTNSSITVDAQGRLTSASSGSSPITSVTASAPLASSGGATPNITITPAPTTNGRLIYDTGTTWGAISDVAAGQVLISNGVTGTPAYSASPSVTTLTGTTSVLAPLLDANAVGTLSIGTSTATGITAGKAGVPLTATGGLLANDLDRITVGSLTIGTSTANGITIGGGAIVTVVAGTGGLQVAGNLDRSTSATLAIGTVNASGITIGTSSTSVNIASQISDATLFFDTSAGHSITATQTAVGVTGLGVVLKGGQGGNASNPTAAGAGAFESVIGGKGGNGDGTLGPGAGGVLNLTGGAGGTQGGTGSAAGGACNVGGGAASGTSANGGNVNITGGAAAGSGTAGAINICATGGSGCNNVIIGGATSSKVTYNANAALLISSTPPTISSGFGTGATVSAANGTAAFRISVGTTSATTGVIGLPTAATGWNCYCTDITTNSVTVSQCKQTASAATTATIGNFTDIAGAAAWVDNDVIAVSCFAF